MTGFMEHLVMRYGMTILLDSTYNITNDGLILFMGAVQTNEGFQPVFAFTLYNETTDAIAKALKWLKENKRIQPEYMITDKSAAELSAIAEVFPGRSNNSISVSSQQHQGLQIFIFFDVV
jgi:hypothetical protein